MEIGLLVLTFAALTLAAWMLEQFFDHALSKTVIKVKRKLLGSAREQIDDTFCPTVRSKFATTDSELEIVLQLRRSFFQENVIVSDESYRECNAKNRYCFKLIFADLQPIGYWGVIPISKETFDDCRSGILNHEEVIKNRAIRWDETKDQLYLYVVGAVVPLGPAVSSDYSSLLKGLFSKYVILDIYSFATFLNEQSELAGVIAWPSRNGGLNSLRRTKGFKKTDAFMAGDENHPIFELEDREQFLRFTQEKFDRHPDSVPIWDHAEKMKFIANNLSRRRGE